MKNTIYTLVIIMSLFSVSCKQNNKKSEVKSDLSSMETTELKTAAIKIIPIEHATTIIEWGDITVYIDPVGGAEVFEGQKQPDLILITDIHGDHFSVATLEALNTEKAKIIAPQAVADKIPAEFTAQIDVLANGETKERYEILVEAIPMYNLREEALKFHTKGRGNGYVLTLGEQRLYFSGDTEDIPEMRALENIDKAFICMNLPYTMTEESAASAVLEFAPKQVYPYHYRGKPNVSDVIKFGKIVNEGNSEIEVVQMDWYPNDEF